MTVPSIFCQAFTRIQFVKFYIKVEGAIIQAMENHRREHTSTNNDTSDNTSSSDGAESLTLAMNDWTSGLAAGVGYGFMHAILLCGTLLASEARDDAGVLYQDSCKNIPSVLNTSFMAMLFSVLDVVIMLLYFYAVRRKAENDSMICNVNASTFGVGNDRSAKAASANAAIIAALIAHTSAAFASWLNGSLTNGCFFALPLVAAVVCVVGVFFCLYVMPFYLPASQRRQIESRMD